MPQRRKKQTIPDLTKQVEIDLRHLRALTRDVFRTCAAKLEAQIEQAANTLLHGMTETHGAASQRKRESLLKGARQLLAALRIKPEKGRYRDIKRLHILVDELTELAARMQ